MSESCSAGTENGTTERGKREKPRRRAEGKTWKEGRGKHREILAEGRDLEILAGEPDKGSGKIIFPRGVRGNVRLFRFRGKAAEVKQNRK